MKEKQIPLFPGQYEPLKLLSNLERREVEPLAFKILCTIEDFCVKAQIAGSIRRCRPLINDIDIVVQTEDPSSVKPERLRYSQPRVGDTVSNRHHWLDVIKEVRREFDASTEKQGDALATLHVPFASKQGQGYVQVDLYKATEATWGILLLVRTGSADHNIYLCNLALAKGLRLQYSQGLVDKDGKVIAGKTEEEVFAALGLPFIIPQDREIKPGPLRRNK